MSSDHVPHVIRTAADPRQEGLHKVYISEIKQVNDNTRIVLLRLPTEERPIRHLPGQWLDVHIPSVPQVGGFTITSSPPTAILAPLNSHPYIELAIQKSPENTPAAFFWRPIPEIRGTELQVRVGGNFVWPPPTILPTAISSLQRAVFIAGGVGINPLISMLTSMSESMQWPPSVRVFYSVRIPSSSNGEQPNLSSILFYNRLKAIARDARHWDVDFKVNLILTGATDQLKTEDIVRQEPQQQQQQPETNPSVHDDTASEGSIPDSELVDISYGSRIQWADIHESLGDVSLRKDTVVYVCGPPAMTDEIVEGLVAKEELDEKRVLCEKWW